MNEFTYQDIPGWMDFEPFYNKMVEEAKDGAVFVEVGCWLGRSTCYLAQKIKESGKAIRLIAVDTWQGTPGNENMQAVVKNAGGSILEMFNKNMQEASVGHIVSPLVMPSLAAAAFQGITLAACDFVFIDADHSYEAVKADILAWLPKVKVGGVLAGHDWCNAESVRLAVRETLGDKFTVEGTVWVYRKL